MGSVLPLVGIVGLMVVGLVVLLTALTYDPPVKSARPSGRVAAREHRPQWRQRRRHAQHALSARRSAVGQLSMALRTRAITLVHEWWPRLRHHAHDARNRWLTLRSTTGHLIAGAAASLVAVYLVVLLG